MTKSEINKMCGLVGRCAYNEKNKQEFRRLATKLLRELRSELKDSGAEVRYNPGGIAVSGDATLHSDVVYVTLNADGICGLGILYRTCKGQKDYTGGHNNWFGFEQLKREGVAGLANAVQGLIDERNVAETGIERGGLGRNLLRA